MSFIKKFAGDFIGSLSLYAVIVASYYLAGDYDPEAGYQNKAIRVKKYLQDLMELFGLDLPAWLQILIIFIVFGLFVHLLILVVKSIISWFKKN